MSVDENARSQIVAMSSSFACEAQRSVRKRPERREWQADTDLCRTLNSRLRKFDPILQYALDRGT